MSTLVPTQVAQPAKTTVRTVVQTILGILIAAGIVIPLTLGIVQSELEQWLSADLVTLFATVSAVAVAVSAILTRVMAIPQVNDWLGKVGLQAGAPSGSGADNSGDGFPPYEPDPARRYLDGDHDGQPDIR